MIDGTGSSLLSVHIQPYVYTSNQSPFQQSLISTWISIGPGLSTTLHNKKSITISEDGPLSVYNNGNIINSYNGTPFTIQSPSYSGNLQINVEEYGKVRLSNNYVSYCAAANSFVAKTQKQIYGDYYMAVEGEFYFQYTGEYNESILNYELTDALGNVVSSLSYTIEELLDPGSIDKKNADNRYKMTFGTLTNGFYVLKVTNIKGEEEFIRIKL